MSNATVEKQNAVRSIGYVNWSYQANALEPVGAVVLGK
ncbi:hypothetical protein ACPOL_3305 [Acidisarcina polymorpha]|uniref:Uncharacterized protein n=1 Tax=Acidisarcina polymorpha TaxID=2211140 RepID=A0A2Z5G1Z3_9BACT|nr:hypothetical protein ACPOL_3305 [Acidisarcina polymorpha]